MAVPSRSKGKAKWERERDANKAASGKVGVEGALGTRQPATAFFKKRSWKKTGGGTDASALSLRPPCLGSFVPSQDDETHFHRGGASLLRGEEAVAKEGLEREMKWGNKNQKVKKKNYKDKWGSLPSEEGITWKHACSTNRVKLKVDMEQPQTSLEMKSVPLGDGTGTYTISGMNENETVSSQTASDALLVMQQNGGLSSAGEIFGKLSSDTHSIHEQVESRASALPLKVVLDDTGDSGVDNGASLSLENIWDNGIVAKRSNRHSKKKEKEDRELKISASEERRLQKDIPRTEDEFEQLVRSSPNSSFVWIKYMAFLLSVAEIHKARLIAERALRTINIQEEDEKLNIWVAYFNLENEYGRPSEEAVKGTFQRALQYCDPKMLHLALLGMYERTQQHKSADELLEKMVKKFKNSCKIWLRCLHFILKHGKDGVPSVVNRALLGLPRYKHIKFISQAAIQEFKYGVPDRGRSMLEGLLRDHPKRTDLWSTYVDQEIRIGDVEVTRALFERATSLSLPPKKMKFLFKKYLEYEKSMGNEDKVEYVKRKALAYVETQRA